MNTYALTTKRIHTGHYEVTADGRLYRVIKSISGNWHIYQMIDDSVIYLKTVDSKRDAYVAIGVYGVQAMLDVVNS